MTKRTYVAGRPLAKTPGTMQGEAQGELRDVAACGRREEDAPQAVGAPVLNSIEDGPLSAGTRRTICPRCQLDLTLGWVLDLPVPTYVHRKKTVTKPLSLNDRLDFRVEAPVIAEIRQTAAQMARVSRVPRLQQATVQLVVTPPDRRSRDVDSLVATSKPAVDGLRDAGVLDDDSPEHVTHLMPRLAAPAGRWELALHIAGIPV